VALKARQDKANVHNTVGLEYLNNGDFTAALDIRSFLATDVQTMRLSTKAVTA
jgi:lipoprotein NlpI